MVTLYGAGERTGILNVEGKLGKALGKKENTLVVTADSRDKVLNEISARAARYERFDPETTAELKQLRQDVKDIFDKGLQPGDEIMEELFFLDNKTRAVLDKMSASYDQVITPNDFKAVAKIMSEHLGEQVPILKDFTKFFGRLAESYLKEAKPSDSDFDWKTLGKQQVVGEAKTGYRLPSRLSELLGLPKNKSVSAQLLERFNWWSEDAPLRQMLEGVPAPVARRTGGKYLKMEITVPNIGALTSLSAIRKRQLFKELKLFEVELFKANKLPKAWTNVPSVNFDGKVLEQNFTQSFEEKLLYKNANGEWTTNILQIPQKTSLNWWEELLNKSGKINDIADVTKARTAYAVNLNHSNDATLVKQFHIWGSKNDVPTSTIHDAFFTNVSDMLDARKALRSIYANAMDRNIFKSVLDEMLARGLPKETYDSYLNEAIEKGLIPVAGKSKIGGRVIEDSDILKKDDILREVPENFDNDLYFYGVG
jgi:hypothetical protein